VLGLSTKNRIDKVAWLVSDSGVNPSVSQLKPLIFPQDAVFRMFGSTDRYKRKRKRLRSRNDF